MVNSLILFYLGSHTDDRGRLLAEILEQDDHWLEVSHDYIQWLFPTREHSRVTPHSPILTPVIEQQFKRDNLLQRHLRASLQRMLAFYGLVQTTTGIQKSVHWQQRKANWFLTDTHNNLRITRILKSLQALGLEQEADEFYQALIQLRETEPDCGIGETAFSYWTEAVGRN